MGSAFVTLLREGLEAALIVGIVLAYLGKTGNRDRFPVIWAGTAAAVAVSVVTGGALFLTLGELEGRAEQVFEGVAMLSAAGVLTWMIFWMRRQASGLRNALELRIDDAMLSGSIVGLAAVVFFAVLREGWESALFVFAISESSTPAATAIGATLGLLVAVVLGLLVYRGSRRLDLRQFFTVTGAVLIVLAAGLAAHGVHELQEASVLPMTVEHIWDTNAALDEGSGVGEFLKTLFGYNGNPSLLEFTVWATYLGIGLTLYLAPLRRRRAEPATA
jgi:high-affinity iron transporter